jgi:class 3 adenylate cyclase
MTGRSTAGMHAFLFADLRGYTQFAATRGDRAAAELLDRYRTLVREQVARHAGAEVRTEGDSFYILFTSVSEAVQCALAIATAARQASLDDPALPLNVGIGVHFGETVDTAEGSVGSAVNMASRLASAAGPNEVLVSDVVRSLLGGSAEIRTVRAGARRLKGFAEPVLVFQALPAEGLVLSPRARRLRPNVPIAIGAVVALVTVGLVLASNLGAARPTPSLSPPGASASTTPVPTARPFDNGLMEPGQYAARDFAPNVDLQLADEWCGGPPHTQSQNNQFTGPDSLYLWTPGMAGSAIAPIAGEQCAGRQIAADAGYLELNHVEQVYAPTACDDGATRSIGGSWNALTDYLTSRPGTSVTNRASATFGGVVGVGFDVHVDQGTVCLSSGAPVRAILAFPTTVVDVSGASRVAAVWWGEGQYLRIWVVDVDGRLVVATIGHEGSSEPLSRGLLEKVYRVIQKLRFVPTS